MDRLLCPLLGTGTGPRSMREITDNLCYWKSQMLLGMERPFVISRLVYHNI